MPTVKNTAQTQADISGNIYTNGSNLVTAAMVASVLQNISVSYINRVTDLPLLGLKAFSATTSYLVGDCCIYTGTLYQCTTAHLGAWSAGDFTAIGGGGTGTVTSVAAGTGMSFTTITASGSVAIDTGKVPYISGGFGASAGLLKWNGSTAFTIDTSTYLTSGTGAGGNLGGTYPNPNVVGLLGSNFPTVPTSGTYQLQATTSGGSVTAWAFVASGMANPMTAVGDLIVGSTVTGGVAAPARLGIGSANYFLQSSGTTSQWFNLFGTANSFSQPQTITYTSGTGFIINGANTSGTYDLKIGATAANFAYSKWTNNTNNYGELFYRTTGGGFQGWNANIAGTYGSTYDYTNKFNITHGGYSWQFGAESAYNATLFFPTYHDIKLKMFSGNDNTRYLRFYTDNTGSAYTERFAIQAYADNSKSYFNNVVGLGINQTNPVSTLQVNGSFSVNIVSKTGNYTLTSTDNTVLFNGTSLTATLPAASGCFGRIYNIVNQNATALTTSSFQSLLNVGTTTVASGTSITIQSDGTNWYQIK